MARLVPILLLSLSLVALPGALAEDGSRLASLGWDDQIDSSVRSGISTALWEERDELSSKKNEAGENYIRVYTNEGVEYREGRPTTYVTVQRCLEERMVTELWRYSFEESGKDYEIVDRTKVAEDDSAVYTYYESGDSSRSTQPFTFQHDKLQLEVDAGRAALGFLGDDVIMIGIAASGHLKLDPLNDHEAQFFERELKSGGIDSPIEAVGIRMDPRNTQFLEKTGLIDAEGNVAGEAGGPGVGSDIKGLIGNLTSMIEDKPRYSPYFYDWKPDDPFDDDFTLMVKTTDHGWVYYSYSTRSPRAISVAVENRQGFRMGNLRLKTVSVYAEPEVRKLDPLVRESRPAFSFTAPHRYDAMFDISADNFVAEMDIDLLIMEKTDTLGFGLAGNPTVRYVKTVSGEPLMTVPILSPASTEYGFEETANSFRVMLSREYEKGEKLRLRVAFESPKMVNKVEEAFWTVARGGFLPFFKIIHDGLLFFFSKVFIIVRQFFGNLTFPVAFGIF